MAGGESERAEVEGAHASARPDRQHRPLKPTARRAAAAIQSRAMQRSPVCGRDADGQERLVFRRGRLRKREDDEVRMMREALASLDDLARVKGILLELGRFYNPVTNAPVVEPATRRAVLDHLASGDVAGARTLLETHLASYLRMDTPPDGLERPA
jgi:hypothetical protein